MRRFLLCVIGVTAALLLASFLQDDVAIEQDPTLALESRSENIPPIGVGLPRAAPVDCDADPLIAYLCDMEEFFAGFNARYP